MKILFLSWAYPPVFTGIGAYTFNMARALVKMGHEVCVVSGENPKFPCKEKKEGVTIYRCYKQKDIGSTRLACEILKIARKERVDLIECAEFLGEAAAILKQRKRPPVLIKAHNSGPIRVGRESEVYYAWQRWMQWAAIARNIRQYKNERYSIEHGDLFCTPSSRLLQEIKKQNFSLPRYQGVVPNPIHISEEKFCGQEAPTPTLLFVGRLAIGKGICYLPVVLDTLIAKHPDLRLKIVGGDSYARGIGSLQKWLENQFGPNRDKVEFTGHLNREDLACCYKESWVVLVPSRWDTFPTVVLEAMKYSKPVVASPNGGMNEMLEGTGCPVYDPNSEGYIDAIAALVGDEFLRRKAGESMYLKGKNSYNFEHVCKQYIQFVEQYFMSK